MFIDFQQPAADAAVEYYTSAIPVSSYDSLIDNQPIKMRDF